VTKRHRERYWVHSDPNAKTLCSACDRPVGDNAYLCQTCTGDLEKLLGDIPNLVGDLVVTYTRQSRTTDRSSGSKSAETSVPWSDRASKALDRLMNALTGWVRLIIEERAGVTLIEPHDDALSVSRWLLWHVGWLRHHTAAAEALNDFERAVAEINDVMDLRAERWYAGTCRAEYVAVDEAGGEHDACCAVELYVKPKDTVKLCRNCGTKHDIEARRKWLLAKAEDQLAHMELIGRALASMGEAVTPSQIRGYAFRGRIVAHGLDRKGRELYRVGDVVQVVRENAAEQARKAAKREAKTLQKHPTSTRRKHGDTQPARRKVDKSKITANAVPTTPVPIRRDRPVEVTRIARNIPPAEKVAADG
jgi:hypothetical protein